MEYEFVVDEQAQGIRLDKLCAKKYNLSRTRLASAQLWLNGELVKPSTKARLNDQVKMSLVDDVEVSIEPEQMTLNIVYEDDHLMVINKPVGLVVHPAPGHYQHTLVNGLLGYQKKWPTINGVNRPGIVHRIDKDTSGLLVVAKTDLAAQSLACQIKEKRCQRQYLALVHGHFSHTHGTIDAPIGRDTRDRQKMAVTEVHSRPAVTHFQVLEDFQEYSLVKCQLETGRTHQIRVHMAYIDHPVADDPKYGRRQKLGHRGQLLHACELSFEHPETQEWMNFTCELEPEMASIIERLREQK